MPVKSAEQATSNIEERVLPLSNPSKSMRCHAESTAAERGVGHGGAFMYRVVQGGGACARNLESCEMASESVSSVERYR